MIPNKEIYCFTTKRYIMFPVPLAIGREVLIILITLSPRRPQEVVYLWWLTSNQLPPGTGSTNLLTPPFLRLIDLYHDPSFLPLLNLSLIIMTSPPTTLLTGHGSPFCPSTPVWICLSRFCLIFKLLSPR